MGARGSRWRFKSPSGTRVSSRSAYPALEAPGYFRASSGRFLLRRLPGRYSLRVSGIPWGHALEIPLLSARERVVHFTIRVTLVTHCLVTSDISSSTLRVV